MAAKIKQLDEVVHALTRKYLEMEKEIEDIKKKIQTKKSLKDLAMTENGLL